MKRRNPSVSGDVLIFTDQHGRDLVLTRSDRLVSMDETRLMQFWLCSHYYPRILGAFLFPDRPRGYQRAAGDLGGYAGNRATALGCAAKGRTELAADYQRIADTLCRDPLPGFARAVVDGPVP